MMALHLAVLIRLLFAHLFADFILQTDGMECGKRGLDRQGNPVGRATRMGCQLLHSLIHAALAYVLVGEWRAWGIPVVIFASHLLIDGLKSTLRKPGVTAFLFDQLLHLAVIVLVWLFLIGSDASVCRLLLQEWGSSYRFWAVVAAYLLVLKPASVLLTLFIGKWVPADEADKGLPEAGKWIGYLERVLILTFILTDNIAGVGFLLAAKSIFRFGELKEAKQIRITEYVLIGTLASFAVASLVGMLLVQVL